MNTDPARSLDAPASGDGGQAARLLRDIRRADLLGGAAPLDITLDRSLPLPLYVQIRRKLLTMIASWPDPAVRFHTEDELCRQFGVARMTVRAAIKEFVDDGLLRRKRGSGTFVAFEKVEEQFSPKMDFIDQWAKRGQPLSFDIRRFETSPAPAAFAHALELDAGTPVIFIERLRTAGAIPISIDYRYIPLDISGAFEERSVRERSLLELLELAKPLGYADMFIEAAVAMAETTDILELLPGDPVLLRGMVYFDIDDRPAMAGISYYRSDHTGYSLRIPLGGLNQSLPDRGDGNGDGETGSHMQLGQLVHMT